MLSALMQQLAAQLQGQEGQPQGDKQPQGGILSSPLIQRLMANVQGGQPQGGQQGGMNAQLMQQVMQQMQGQGGQAPQQAGTMDPKMQALVQKFRQMYGRDPANQQELALVAAPSVSQVMG